MEALFVVDKNIHLRTELENRIRFETLISDISARFVRLPSDTVDSEIERALKQILDFFEVDRCGLLGVHKDQRFAKVTHACYAEGIEQVSKEINLAELFPWSYDTLVIKGLPVKVERITQLPPEAEHDYQSWLGMGVKSNLAIPMFSAHGIRHLIVIHAVRKERDWPQEYISRLCLLGEIFVNALERRNADQALRASEYRLNLAAESARAGLWTLDPDSGVFWLTDLTRVLFGFPPDKVITVEDFLEVVHPDDREQISHTIDQARQFNEETVVEYRIIRSDGDVRWMVSRGRFHAGEGEEANRLMGVSVDITERKRAENQLEERLDFERLLADISARFIALSSDQIDCRIELTQKMICEYLDIDACVLWQMPLDQPGTMLLTHLYAPSDIPSMPSVMDGKTNFPWTLEALLKGQTICLSRLADAPAEAHRDIETSRRFGVKSRVTFPLSAGGVVFGALSFIMLREERNWSEDVRSRLRLIAEIFANAIIRKRNEHKLLASKESLRVFTRKLLTIQEEERRRLARELHDDFTQRLAVLAIELSNLEASAKSLCKEYDPKLIDIRNQ
ncbi:MAG: PAS domain-containing protein, partial [Sedimentisphaerales bacterium]|nr:PAS domain-containing protein [Sedimentisphaerales bacterium]